MKDRIAKFKTKHEDVFKESSFRAGMIAGSLITGVVVYKITSGMKVSSASLFSFDGEDTVQILLCHKNGNRSTYIRNPIK